MSSSSTAERPPWKENRNTATDMIILDDSLRCDEEMGGALGTLRQQMTSGISEGFVRGEKSLISDEGGTQGTNAFCERVYPKSLTLVRILMQPMSILIWLAIILEGVTLHYFQMGVLMGIQLLNALICIYRINKTDEAVVLTSKAGKGPAATYQRDVSCQVVDSPLLVPTLGNDRGTTGKCHVNPHSMDEVDQVCLPAVEVDEVALPGGEPPEHEENTGASTDTVFVTQLSLADPYGDTGVYTGALSKSTGMPNGKGRLEYDKKEDRWYDGNWIHGRWNGHGRISNGDGDFYEGGLKNDHKHGTAVMRFADGRVFEGEYIRGQMIQGKMTYQDGSVYEGCLADGMRHGRGKYIFIDGSKYEGEFEKGHIQGRGQMIWNDGGWYLGEFFEGEMHGNGREIRPDCSLRHDGEWSRGHPIRSTNTASQPIQPPNTAAQKNSHSHIPDGSEVIRG